MAVRAPALHLVSARVAPCALVTADHRSRTSGREFPLAAFAFGLHVEHVILPPTTTTRRLHPSLWLPDPASSMSFPPRFRPRRRHRMRRFSGRHLPAGRADRGPCTCHRTPGVTGRRYRKPCVVDPRCDLDPRALPPSRSPGGRVGGPVLRGRTGWSVRLRATAPRRRGSASR